MINLLWDMMLLEPGRQKFRPIHRTDAHLASREIWVSTYFCRGNVGLLIKQRLLAIVILTEQSVTSVI